MKIIEKEPEDWIKHFATIIGTREGVDIDENIIKTSGLKACIRWAIPPLYDSYAIIFHSFALNKKMADWYVKESKLSAGFVFNDEGYDRMSWKDFFKHKGKEFDLETTVSSYISQYGYEGFTSMTNELYPAEGGMDIEHLNSLIEIIFSFYGNQDIEAFYTCFSTWDYEDKLYEGKILELGDLLKDENLRLSPSLIYAKDKSWVVNTDYDLPFSFMGGEQKIISALVTNNKDEIYEVKY